MRTTVDLPPYVHRRAKELAQQNGRSLSAEISDLVSRSLQAQEPALPEETDPRTGLPQLRIGRAITSEDVAAFLAEDD